jgi:putative oxidoreductase
MQRLITDWQRTVQRLEGLGQWLAPLGLRLLLAWEFWEAGLEKLRGSNWFEHIQQSFPFPFSQVSTELSWAMATWFELIGTLALVFGLATRFFAFSLAILTIVAIASVHWPAEWDGLAGLWQGYAITDKGHGNFKLPLIFLVMLLPLILRGAGRFSLDALISQRLRGEVMPRPNADLIAWAGFSLLLGLSAAMLLPIFGFATAALGGALLALGVISAARKTRADEQAA